MYGAWVVHTLWRRWRDRRRRDRREVNDLTQKPKTRSNRNPGPRCDGDSYQGAVEGRVPPCQPGGQPEDFPEHTAQQQERVRTGLRLLDRIIARAHLGRQADRARVRCPGPPPAGESRD